MRPKGNTTVNPIQAFFSSFDYSWITSSIFRPEILRGIVITIVLAVISQFLGVVIGLILYFMRRSRLRPIRWVADTYVWVFRGTPLIVQIIFSFNFIPYLGLRAPLASIDPFFITIGFSGVIMQGIVAALGALSLNEGAYMAEIVRAGIDSIDAGQMEAAKSLGMTYWVGMRRIVLPQAARIIIPPLGNEFNGMIKNTSLVAYVSIYDLFGAAKAIGDPAFRTLELMIVASIWYLVLTTLWGFVQSWLERKFGASTREPGGQESFWRRLLGVNPPSAPAKIAPVEAH